MTLASSVAPIYIGGMNQTASVTLDDQLASFVETQLREGRYGSAGEVLAAGLRLLRDEESRYQALADALAEGEASGEPQPFDFDEFLAEMKAK